MPHGHSNLWFDRASELWAVQTHPMSSQLFPSLRWVGGARSAPQSEYGYLSKKNKHFIIVAPHKKFPVG